MKAIFTSLCSVYKVAVFKSIVQKVREQGLRIFENQGVY